VLAANLAKNAFLKKDITFDKSSLFSASGKVHSSMGLGGPARLPDGADWSQKVLANNWLR